MSDYFKTIKLLNNSLIASCLALILIGLPTNLETNKYAEALDEIRRIKLAQLGIDTDYKDYIKKQYGDTLRIISQALNELPFEPAKIWHSNHRKNYPLNDLNLGIDNMNYWNNNRIIKYHFGNTLKDELDKKALNKWFLESNKDSSANGWGFYPAGDKNVRIILLKNGETINLEVFYSIKILGYEDLYIKRKELVEYKLDAFDLLIKTDTVVEHPLHFVNCCPALKDKEIWFTIATEKLDDVEDYLKSMAKTKKESQRKPLSIFGFSIPSVYAWLVGPLIIISLLVFLTLHINQLKIELFKVEKAETYPWIGIYRGFWSRLVFSFMIILLPLIACWLALDSSNIEIYKKFIYCTFYTTVIYLIGLLIFRQTESIISKL